MFTFSFGSAFAAEQVPGESTATTRNEAIAEAQKDLIEALEAEAKAEIDALADQYKETVIDADCVIDGSVYAETIKQIVADYTAVINTAAKKVKADTTIQANYAAAIANTAVAAYEYAGAAVEVKLADLGDLGDVATATTGYYAVYTWSNALDAMKTYVNGELAKIDMSLYTEDVIDASAAYPQTWAEKAAEIKADKAEVVADTVVDMSLSAEKNVEALKAMYAVLDDLVEEDSYTDIYGNKYVTSYKLPGLKTADQLAGEDVSDEVAQATLKAQLASVLAAEKQTALVNYQTKAWTKAEYEARLEALDAYEEVNTLLIEEGKVTSSAQFVASNVAAARIALYEAAADEAVIAKIQVEKDGSAKYDAAKVDEILAKAQVAIYAGEATSANFSGALVGEDLFAWNKEVKLAKAKANLEKALDDEDFYAPEAEKVEAKYQALFDKIEAAANQKQLDECKIFFDATTIDNEGEVEGKIKNYANTVKFETAVENYLKLYNLQSGAKYYEDAYIDEDVDTDDIVEYLAEAGARSNADVAALLGEAEAYAQSVEDNGTKAAAEEAAQIAATEAIKALPTVISLDDKAAVEEAYKLAKKAGMTGNTKLQAAIAAVKKAEENAIDKMFKALPAKITVADEAAVDAVVAAVEAYEETGMYASTKNYDAQVTAAEKAVRAAELAAVHAAIAAISVDDEASVEAARAAADAYVAEYTSAVDADRAVADIQNMDKLTYAEAAVAAAKIEAVEALKITAGSSAKKGSITVKWTVEGETDAVEGYEIWRSTKKNSGFKKMFTTTKTSYKNTKNLKKGTRYYFKVRAIAYVGAEKVKSDWSNKAYRVAK